MSRVCAVCGKGPMSGNRISHSHIRTRRIWAPNIHKVKLTDEKGKVTYDYVCSRCLRTMKKEG